MIVEQRPNSASSTGNSPTKLAAQNGGAPEDAADGATAVRRSSFLARVQDQQRTQEKYLVRQGRKHRSVAGLTEKQHGKHPHAETECRPHGNSTARIECDLENFSVCSTKLVLAPDGVHYFENSGRHSVVDTTSGQVNDGNPFCVLLVQRRAPREPDTARRPRYHVRGADAGDDDDDDATEEVDVRHVPMSDLLKVIRRSQSARQLGSNADAPLLRVHDGKEGLTTMHVEVSARYSFLPGAVRHACGQRQASPLTSDDDTAIAAHHGPHGHRDYTVAVSIPSQEAGAPFVREPSVYDFFLAPPLRTVELLKEKHKNKLAYLRHKMKYTRQELEQMSLEDRRNYLTCERRFLFLRQYQRDLDARLKESNWRREHRAALVLARLLPRRQPSLSAEAATAREIAETGGAEGLVWDEETGFCFPELEGRRRSGRRSASARPYYPGPTLYVLGREIPQELVQTFFSLNDEYETFQRALRKKQQRAHHSGGAAGDATRRAEARPPPTDLVSDVLRWGDALLFPGQRPAEGYVVVTAGPRGLRGWGAVLGSQRTADARHSDRQRNGSQKPTAPQGHIDLYAMARVQAQPAAEMQPRAERSAASAAETAGPASRGNEEDDDSDPLSYLNHFRYRLFYASDSDEDSDDDFLCSEDDGEDGEDDNVEEHGAAVALAGTPDKGDGSRGRVAPVRRLSRTPMHYGKGHYLPRPSLHSSAATPNAAPAEVPDYVIIESPAYYLPALQKA